MAGTADSGIEAAVPDLAALKPYVLTPVNGNTGSGSEDGEVLNRWATVYHCRHLILRRAVARVSHLPVMSVLG